MKLVTIYNTEHLKWFDGNGPFFGMLINDGLFSLLRFDPTVKMKLTTRQEAENERREYYERYAAERQKENRMAEQLHIGDSFKIESGTLVKPVVKDGLDSEIDNILTKQPETIEQKTEMKKYTTEELTKLTKKEMKQILRSRGYTSGPNAGKYHDNVKDLVEKILRTQ